jgi:hypothetical protein
MIGLALVLTSSIFNLMLISADERSISLISTDSTLPRRESALDLCSDGLRVIALAVSTAKPTLIAHNIITTFIVIVPYLPGMIVTSLTRTDPSDCPVTGILGANLGGMRLIGSSYSALAKRRQGHHRHFER